MPEAPEIGVTHTGVSASSAKLRTRRPGARATQTLPRSGPVPVAGCHLSPGAVRLSHRLRHPLEHPAVERHHVCTQHRWFRRPHQLPAGGDQPAPSGRRVEHGDLHGGVDRDAVQHRLFDRVVLHSALSLEWLPALAHTRAMAAARCCHWNHPPDDVRPEHWHGQPGALRTSGSSIHRSSGSPIRISRCWSSCSRTSG